MKSCKMKNPNIEIINNKNICCYCNEKFNYSRTAYRHKKICKQEQITTINNNNTTNINNNINNNTNNLINNSFFSSNTTYKILFCI